MRLNGLDLNLLVALDALLTERNITRAGEKIFISQPGMSNALARLRDYFQDELLMPSGRQYMLTARAESLVGPLREILIRIESTIAAQVRFDPLTSTRLFTLQVSDFTSVVLIPPLITRIYAEAPNVRLNLQALPDDPIEMLDRGEPDLMIIPSQYVSPHHPSQIIFEEQYICVIWDGNTRIPLPLTFDSYIAAGHVAGHYASTGGPTMDTWFLQSYGMARRIEVTAPTLTALIHMVVGTDRIVTIHKRLADREIGRLPIKCTPPPIEIPKVLQAMQWHTHRDRDPALAWLRQCVIEVAQQI